MFTPQPEPSLPPSTFPLLFLLGWGPGTSPVCRHAQAIPQSLPPSFFNPSFSLSDARDPGWGLCGAPQTLSRPDAHPRLDEAEPLPVSLCSDPTPTLVQLLPSFLMASLLNICCGLASAGARWWAESHSSSLTSGTSYSMGSWGEMTDGPSVGE